MPSGLAELTSRAWTQSVCPFMGLPTLVNIVGCRRGFAPGRGGACSAPRACGTGGTAKAGALNGSTSPGSHSA